MTDSAFAADAAVVRNALASDLGCDESAFAMNDLTVVPRPADSRERQYAALAATLGTGTVLSVDPPFLDWARANRPAAHHHVLYPAFLAALAGEIAVAEPGATPYGQTIGYVLSRSQAVIGAPPGLALALLDRAEIEQLWPSGHFTNALGDTDEPAKFESIAGAIALQGKDGVPLAVAGAWREGPGILEIGVDVRREARGHGLAVPVVAAMATWIVETGMTPTYTVAATNIRSQRVAASCGFAPFWTVAAVKRAASPLG